MCFVLDDGLVSESLLTRTRFVMNAFHTWVDSSAQKNVNLVCWKERNSGHPCFTCFIHCLFLSLNFFLSFVSLLSIIFNLEVESIWQIIHSSDALFQPALEKYMMYCSSSCGLFCTMWLPFI